MSHSTIDFVKAVDKRVGALFKAQTQVMGAYSKLATAASADGALDTKTKELMALAISVSIRCEDCIAYHTRAAIKHDATQEQVMETLAVAVEMGGGPSVVYGGRALEIYKGLAE